LGLSGHLLAEGEFNMIGDKLGYQVVNNTTVVIKPTPAGFFGLSVTGAGNVTVYDNASAASGVVLYTKTGATAGDTVSFGSNGIAANNGLTVISTGTVVVLYT
jgi:hypothetical protein